MSETPLRIAEVALLLLFVFLSGFGLSHWGKPYGTVLFTLHKVIALAAGILVIVTVYQAHQATALEFGGIAAAVVTGVLFAGTIAAGGLLSIEKPMPKAVARLHLVMPFLTVLAAAGTLYLVLRIR